MACRLHFTRTAAYQPALAWFAGIGAFWVYVLVMLGAFTTSIGAGMVFPDWPLSNGSLNPRGWLDDLAMFAEHSHRLSAALMSVITVALFVWIWRTDARPWLRRLAGFAVALVLVQALVGGLRVLLDHWHVSMVDTSVGRLFAMLHACLAQIFVCTLLAIPLALSRPWIEGRGSQPDRGVRLLGLVACALLLVQLGVAAVMRHSFAGMAIPTFPWSTPEGHLLPAAWNFQIGIHFAHRLLALVLTGVLVWLAVRVWRSPAAGGGLRAAAAAVVALLAAQIALGAFTIWSGRDPHITTAHVLVGALLLATTFGVTWWSHRPVVPAGARPATASPLSPARSESLARA